MSDRRFDWYASLTGKASFQEVAKNIGMDPQILIKEMQDDQLSPGTVIALAQAYGQRTTLALAITGLVPAEDVTRPLTIEERLQLASTEELLLEIAERIEKDPKRMADALKKSVLNQEERE